MKWKEQLQNLPITDGQPALTKQNTIPTKNMPAKNDKGTAHFIFEHDSPAGFIAGPLPTFAVTFSSCGSNEDIHSYSISVSDCRVLVH